MGGRQMAPGRTVKQRKALSLGALPGLPNKGQERQNHPHHNHHKCTVPPQKRLIATLKIETKKFLPPLCSPPSPSPAKHAFPLTFLFSPGFILSLRLRKRIYSSSPPQYHTHSHTDTQIQNLSPSPDSQVIVSPNKSSIDFSLPVLGWLPNLEPPLNIFGFVKISHWLQLAPGSDRAFSIEREEATTGAAQNPE